MEHGRRNLPDRRMGISTGALLQMVEQNDEKAEAGHQRLRQDIRSLERRLESQEKAHGALSERLTRFEATPTELSNLRVPMPMLATIVIGFLAIGAGMWSFRSDMVTRMDQSNASSTSKYELLQQSNRNLEERIKTLDQQQRLQNAEFQTFRQEMARRSR
jgi:chaperonin cofactor prefoldin